MATPEKREVRILIMDDYPQGLAGLGRTFWDAGWDLSFAFDEKTLLKKLKILSFDLILINLGVKGFDLEKLEEALRFDSPDDITPVIALVPCSVDFDPSHWLARVIVDYIQGREGEIPWDYAEVAARVANHLGYRRSLSTWKNKVIELEKSNRDKDKFYNILSHDLKAPFQGLVGLLEVLHGELGTLTEDEIREYIRNIHDSTKRTYRLLENLMEWSGLQGGQLHWVPEELELSLLVKDVLGVFKIGARDKGIHLEMEIEPDLMVFADRRMLSSIIRNLVNNGIKFTDRGGSVLVRAKESVDYFEISVEDTGVGVLPENLNKLLRNGEAETTPGTAQESGSGLGLKISRQFIEMNGGQLWVRSEPGKGSSFLFSLPKRKVDLSVIGESSLKLIRHSKVFGRHR